jgi:hypothetical protein
VELDLARSQLKRCGFHAHTIPGSSITWTLAPDIFSKPRSMFKLELSSFDKVSHSNKEVRLQVFRVWYLLVNFKIIQVHRQWTRRSHGQSRIMIVFAAK